MFTEKMIARNRIFRVAGPFLLSVPAFKCKALFKWRPPFPRPVSQRALFLSLIALSCSLRPSLRPLRPLIAPVSPLDSPFAPPPLFRPFFPTPEPISSFPLSPFLVGFTQLRRPWDKRLHFLIFKCAQTSYRAIVRPSEALRRGFRADKPVRPPRPSVHAPCTDPCIHSSRCTFTLHSLRYRGNVGRGGKCKSRERRL